MSSEMLSVSFFLYPLEPCYTFCLKCPLVFECMHNMSEGNEIKGSKGRDTRLVEMNMVQENEFLFIFMFKTQCSFVVKAKKHYREYPAQGSRMLLSSSMLCYFKFGL